jgi:polar amino acid transport system substrate-binding protein
MKERIDFTLLPELVGRILIQKTYPNQLSAFSFAQKPESSDTFHLMVSKEFANAKELIEEFNKGLIIIKENGTYKNIFQQYKVPIEYEVYQ